MRSHSAHSMSAAAAAQAAHAAVLQEKLSGGSQALRRSADEAREITCSGETPALGCFNAAFFQTVLCRATPSGDVACYC